MDIKTLPNNLKRIRENLKYTHEEIAKKLYVTTTTYYGYENGLSTPSFNMLVILSNILNVSLDYLILNRPQIENDYLDYFNNNLNQADALLSGFDTFKFNNPPNNICSSDKSNLICENDNIEDNMYFAENLRKIRKEKNMKQQEMADYLGLKFSTYRQYESKRREPGLITLVDITIKLNTTIDYLLKNFKRDNSKYIEYDKIIKQLTINATHSIEALKQQIINAKNNIENLKQL